MTGSHQEVVESQSFTLQNLHESVRRNRPAIFNIDKSIVARKKDYVIKLLDDKKPYRTTTRNSATFRDVLKNSNGTTRIEEGVHNERWESGSGGEIVQMLFEPDSLMAKA